MQCIASRWVWEAFPALRRLRVGLLISTSFLSLGFVCVFVRDCVWLCSVLGIWLGAWGGLAARAVWTGGPT